jgi:hypothetical protein
MKYEIVLDEDAPNPREENRNIGTILYHSHHYDLGDRFATVKEIQDIIRDENVLYLPVYALVHSGIELSTSPFNDPWDSGQSGIIYIKKDDAKKLWAKKEWSDDLRDPIEKALRQEVEEFGAYLAGRVYGWRILDDSGNVLDASYGYYSENEAEEDAKLALEVLRAEKARREDSLAEYGG